MRRCIVLLVVGLLSSQAWAADSARVRSEGTPVGSAASPPGAITASAAREVDRATRSTVSERRNAQPTGTPRKTRGWIARHPKLVGALVGFGVGCVVGVSRVGGSEDTFVNALDEFACPVIGGIGAGVGALIGVLVK